MELLVDEEDRRALFRGIAKEEKRTDLLKNKIAFRRGHRPT